MATVTLGESYAHCERISRERAKNFYYSFLLLPRPKRQAMCAIYAFMRECDDRSTLKARLSKASSNGGLNLMPRLREAYRTTPSGQLSPTRRGVLESRRATSTR